MAIRLNDALRTKIVDKVMECLSGTSGTSGSAGLLKVYGGTQPTLGGDTAGTQAIIVQISSISWTSSTNGTAAITTTIAATAGTNGTVTWARLSDSSGTSYIIDGTCETSVAADFVLDVMTITANEVVTLTAATIVQPGS